MMKTRLAAVILFLAAVPMFGDDLSRLSAILLDAQNSKVTISSDAWKVSGNEANALATRIASKSGSKAARDLRTHVRQMRDAALSGDVSGAQSHASQAMPFVYQLTK